MPVQRRPLAGLGAVEDERRRDAAVLGIPDVRTGERVVAVVVTHSGRALTLSHLREHFAASGVAKQKTPEQVELVTEIPRNPMGKVRKDALPRTTM